MDSLFSLMWSRTASAFPTTNKGPNVTPYNAAAPPADADDRATGSIQRLQQTKHAYVIRAQELERAVSKDTVYWKSLYAQNKQKEATIVWHRCKNSQKELQSILARVNNIDTQISSVKQSSLDVDTVAAYQEANSYRTEVKSYIDASRVDEVADTSREHLTEQLEIQEALDRPLDPQAENADADVTQSMMAEEFGPTAEEAMLLNAPAASHFAPMYAQPQAAPTRPIAKQAAAPEIVSNGRATPVAAPPRPAAAAAASLQQTAYDHTSYYNMDVPAPVYNDTTRHSTSNGTALASAPAPSAAAAAAAAGGRRLKNLEALVNVNL